MKGRSWLFHYLLDDSPGVIIGQQARGCGRFEILQPMRAASENHKIHPALLQLQVTMRKRSANALSRPLVLEESTMA